MFHHFASILIASCLFLSTCKQLPVDPAFNKSVSVEGDTVLFAVIGDYGENSPDELRVANLVKSWNPEFIITTGDNNYPAGNINTIKANIADYFCDYIYNPDAPANLQCHGKATEERKNRFFPSPGNHDNYSVPALGPYKSFFTLPGDETNYDFEWGPVHFYSINTGTLGDKACCTSDEASWLNNVIPTNKKPFKFVYFHHPPYSPGNHGSSVKMRWPFTDWGVDAVLCGHEHFYARIKEKAVANPVYIICGSSGNETLYSCNAHPLDTSKLDVYCENTTHGAMKVKATKHHVVFEYYSVNDSLHPLDVYSIYK